MREYVYRSYQDLVDLIKINQARIASYQFDLIVGLPRRGMIPAEIIGLSLNKPVISFNELVADLVSEKIGYRLKEADGRSPKSYQNILLIDDSTNKGEAFEQALDRLDAETKNKITTMSIYSTKLGASKVDLTLEVMDSNKKLFEWNILHKKTALENASMRFEGIIASNALDGEWKLLVTPSYPVKIIVSGLRENFRPQIEEFLKENNVSYEKLFMEVFSSKRMHEIVESEGIKLHYETDSLISRDLNDVVAVYNIESNRFVNPTNYELEIEYNDEDTN